MHRNGKIARLPREIRQELNERLSNEEMAKPLVAWLNGLPEVQAVLAAEFAGVPIREQNVSEWRKGGYQDWVQHEAALEVAVRLGERAAHWREEGHPSMAETLVFWLMGQLLVATRYVNEAEGDKKWQLVNKMCTNVGKLQRIEQQARIWRLGEEGPAKQPHPMPRPESAQAREQWEKQEQRVSSPPGEVVVKEAASAGESGEHATFRTYEPPADAPLPSEAAAAETMRKARQQMAKWSDDQLARDGFNGGSGRKSVLTGRIKVQRPVLQAAA